MAASPGGGDASAARPSRTYNAVSASYRDKAYSDVVLLVDDARSEIELRQWSGRRKKKETVIARFRLEPNAEVLVDGTLLRVSELSITLESPAAAGEVAAILRRPAREREAMRLLSEAEYAVRDFLETREDAVGFLSKVKVNPREALLSAESLWAADDTEPLDAVYSSYSMRLAESLERMKSSLASRETKLGSSVTERLYALAYTIGAVQNALFEGDSNLVQELAALRELGIATTEQDLRMERRTERLMMRAHPTLAGVATAPATPK